MLYNKSMSNNPECCQLKKGVSGKCEAVGELDGQQVRCGVELTYVRGEIGGGPEIMGAAMNDTVIDPTRVICDAARGLVEAGVYARA